MTNAICSEIWDTLRTSLKYGMHFDRARSFVRIGRNV